MTGQPGVRTVHRVAAIGADPQALDELAAEFRRASCRIDAVVTETGRALRRARWDGPDADRFERDWQVGHRVRLGSCAAACRTLATRLTTQADDQRRASTGGSSGPPIGTGRSVALSPLPRSVDIYSGGLQATFGPFAGSIGGTLALERRSSGRVTVSYSEAAGAGLSASVGSSIGVVTGRTADGVGSAAGAAGRAGGRLTRQWTVAESAVPGLLAALVLENSAVGLPFRATDTVAQGVGDVLSLFGVDVGTDRPSFPLLADAERVERLVGIAGSATATGNAPAVPGGSATVTGDLLVGLSEQGGRTDMVLEQQGSGAVAVSTAVRATLGLDTGSVAAATSLRIETPAPGDVGAGERPTLVTLTSTSDDEQVLVRVAIDPRAAGPAGAELGDALGRLARGDVDGALAALAGIRVPADAFELAMSTASVDNASLSVAVQGPGASITPTGNRTRLTY